MAEKKASSGLLVRHKRIAVFILILLPLSLLIFFAFNPANPQLVIFPAKNIRGRFLAFTDRGFKGTSVIDHFSYTDGIIDLRYTLKKGASSPMVFTILYLGTSEKPFDASNYDSVSITMRESTNKQIQIYMKTFVPGISLHGANNAVTLRHNSYLLKLLPGVHEYTIGFDEFSTPLWWLSNMRVTYSDLPVEKFSKFISFDMQFNIGGSDIMLDQPQKTVIEKIAFNSPFNFIPKLILGFLAFFYSGLGIFAVVRRFLVSRGAMPKQKPVEITSYREQDLTRVREFIESHYSNPEISTRMLYKSLGIPPEKVFTLVLNEYGLTFKQLINKMRIEEAKRLLQESDLRITDIAMNVGFNELTYFNRLFKKYEKMTPSGFRDKAISR